MHLAPILTFCLSKIVLRAKEFLRKSREISLYMLYKCIVLSGQSLLDPVQMQHFNADILAWISRLSLAFTVSCSDTRDLLCSSDLAKIVTPGKDPGS